MCESHRFSYTHTHARTYSRCRCMLCGTHQFIPEMRPTTDQSNDWTVSLVGWWVVFSWSHGKGLFTRSRDNWKAAASLESPLHMADYFQQPATLTLLAAPKLNFSQQPNWSVLLSTLTHVCQGTLKNLPSFCSPDMWPLLSPQGWWVSPSLLDDICSLKGIL